MHTKVSWLGLTSLWRAARLLRSWGKRGSAAKRYAAAQAWVTSQLSLDEASALLALIQHHTHRLQSLGGTATPEVVLDAVLADAARDPVLAGSLSRARSLNLETRSRRSPRD